MEWMKDKDFDCLSFLPTKKGSVEISCGSYKSKDDVPDKSPIGQMFHIVLVKELPSGVTHYDNFEAILSDPLVYMSNLIQSGWYGLIHKKTSSSQEINDDFVEKLKKNFNI